jgi:hypothetical protein
LAGGVPWQGLVVEEVKGVIYAPMLPEMYKNRKNGWFPITENAIFCSEVLNKIYS